MQSATGQGSQFMSVSAQTDSSRERRSLGVSALIAFARATLVFATILAVGMIGVAPPNWAGRVAIWMLGSGIALAAVARWGTLQILPVYCAEVVIDVLYRRAPLPALIAGVGLPAGVLLSLWLLRRWRFDLRFERSRDMPVFTAAALIGMAIPAAVGVAVYSTFYAIDPIDNTPWTFIDFVRWWLNDVLGVLLLGPFLVALRRKSLEPLSEQPLSALACALVLVGLVAAMVVVPPLVSPAEVARPPIQLASTLMVVIVVLRFGLVPGSAAGLLLSATAMCCLALDIGIFQGIDRLRGIVGLWTYLTAVSLPPLLLTWLIAAQRRLERRYVQVFETCPQPLWVHDRATQRFLMVNAAAQRQYGYSRAQFLESTIELLAPRTEELTLATMLTPDAAQPLAVRHRTCDGRDLDVEAWARLIDYEGQPAWLVFAFDVSERKALEGALVNAVSSEQRRLGQDLHDGLAQDLTVASILTGEVSMQVEEGKLPTLEDLVQLGERISSATRSARDIANGLSPLTRSRGDLGAALIHLARSSTVNDTAVEVQLQLEAEIRLSLEARTHLYRIAQEAVQNALKHAGAAHIDIRLEVQPRKVVLEVVDDGRGIRPEDASGSGFGTNTMRYRSSAIGGQLSVRSLADGGTLVTCSVPQSAEADAALAS